jgi:hypothetical protein
MPTVSAALTSETVVGGWLPIPGSPKSHPSGPVGGWLSPGISTTLGQLDVEYDNFAPSPPIELPSLPSLPKKDELVLEFDFSPDVEHASLLGVVFGSMAVLLLTFSKVLHWAVGATLGLLLVGGCLWLFRTRHRAARGEAIQAIRVSERELNELLTETRDIRATFKSAADSLERERLRAVHHLEKELRKTECTLSTATEALTKQKSDALAASEKQREAVQCRYDYELNGTRDGLQKTIAELGRQLSVIDAEFAPSALVRDYEGDVLKELQQQAVAAADEHYFGPALKHLLISEGVTTAAEITPSIVSIPEIGPLRGSAALSWKRSVETQIRKRLACQSPPVNGKKGELERQKEGIEVARRACEAELTRLETDIESRRRAELDHLQQASLAQESAFETELTRLKTESEVIAKRIRRRLAELRNVPELALWNARTSSLEVRIRRIEGLLTHVQDQLARGRGRLTFWQYLRSL